MCAAVVKGRVAPAAARWSAFGPTQVNAASHRPPFAASNAGPRIRLSTLGTRLFLHPAGQPTGRRAFLNNTEMASPGCDFAGTNEAPAQVSRSQMRRYRLAQVVLPGRLLPAPPPEGSDQVPRGGRGRGAEPLERRDAGQEGPTRGRRCGVRRSGTRRPLSRARQARALPLVYLCL